MAEPQMTPQQVLASYWAHGRLPVDPEAIARHAGIALAPLSVGDMASGSYDPHGVGGRPIIKVNRSESPRRIRFTVAHELGHHFLRHGAAMRDTAENFRAMVRDPREVEANQFAANLLMPSTYMKALVVTLGITSLTRLADMLSVSTAAMEIRLKTLGYI